MKPLEAMRNLRGSIYLMPLMGMLLLFSLSIHSHRISIIPDSIAKVAGASLVAGHSVAHCSACILHSNIRIAPVSPVLSPIDPGQSITYKENEYLTPYSFLLKNKPTRSPPAI